MFLCISFTYRVGAFLESGISHHDMETLRTTGSLGGKSIFHWWIAPGVDINFLTGGLKGYLIGFHSNFFAYRYKKLDNLDVYSTCPTSKSGWIWQADNPQCQSLLPYKRSYIIDPNKLLNQQSSGWWFETSWCWCDVTVMLVLSGNTIGRGHVPWPQTNGRFTTPVCSVILRLSESLCRN